MQTNQACGGAATHKFLEGIFYDTLNSVFECIVKVRDLTPEVAEELRRLVLRPNDIILRVEGREQDQSN
jgi:hypothetical protein